MSRLIFVPSKQVAPVPHDHQIPIGNVIATTHQNITPGWDVDPLLDYLTFYAPGGVLFDNILQEWCFWLAKVDKMISFSAIEEWVAQNCREPVLVQKIIDHPGTSGINGGNFRVVFCDGVLARTEFGFWWNSLPKLNHRFHVGLNIDVTALDIKNWLAENTSDWRVIQVHAGRAIVVIENDNDAVAFRLRWSDQEAI
jgi:hypothetical protein